MTPRSEPAVEELRRFLDVEYPVFQKRWGTLQSFEARAAWQRRLSTDGWTTLAWPVEFGGRELPIADRLACELELSSRGCPPLAGLLGISNIGPTLIAFGDEDQKTHLPHIADASEIWCQGFSEPNAGSDLASLRTSARIETDHFVINGEKIWTTNGMQATHCFLLARSLPSEPRHQGISALIVPLDLPGIVRRPIRQMDGQEIFAEIFFDDVVVPLFNLVGPLHEGWRVTMTTLSHERAGVVSQANRLEREVTLEIERAHGTNNPLLRQELVQRYIEGRVLGLTGKRALARLNQGASPGPEHSIIRLAQGTLRQKLALTRMSATGMAAVAGQAPDIEGEFLTSRAASIAAGTREVLKNILAERVLGLPRN